MNAPRHKHIDGRCCYWIEGRWVFEDPASGTRLRNCKRKNHRTLPCRICLRDGCEGGCL